MSGDITDIAPTAVADTPDQVHGRLNEAMHIAGYAFERAWQKFEWLLEGDRWQEVGPGFEDINAFLATVQLPKGASPDQRERVARRIKELQPDASQRKIAGTLNVSEATVARDFGKDRGATHVASNDKEPAPDNTSEPETATPVAPPEPTGDEVAAEAEKRRKAKETREARRAERLQSLEDISVREAKATEGVFDVVVIDPPWPMEKIERDERPNQVAFDYPTMGEDGIAEYVEQRQPFADDCHVWLWTTHRFMPMAFRILDRWGLKYVCTFVWRKPGGFQPVGLPQYNAEFALYARCGAPLFTETTDLPVCFEGPRTRHSEKPDRFYEIVRRVTGGRRLDMFNRREIEGFEREGNEAW